jgi:hypothetical protein
MTKYFWMFTMRGQGTLEPRRGGKLEDNWATTLSQRQEQVFSIKISTTICITPYTSYFKLQCNIWIQFVHHQNVR